MKIQDRLSRSIDRIYIGDIHKYDFEDLRITLTSSQKTYPYVKPIEVPTIKISIMKDNLNFFQRLFTKKLIEHFPVGNLRELIYYKESFSSVLFNSIIRFRESLKI